MAGGGSQKTPSQQTITQSNIPEYLAPYVTSVARRGEEISNRPYEAYTGPRIAGFNNNQTQAFNAVQGLGGTYQPLFSQGSTAMGQAQTGYQGTQNYQPTNFTTNDITSQDWNSGIASQYMNPYTTQVLQKQEGLATERFLADQTRRDLSRAKSGSFGGYRHGIANEVARDQFNRGLDLTAAESLQRGYDTAYGQFANDRNSSITTQAGNRAANFAAQQAGEQSRQFGANLGLQGAQGLSQIGQQLYQQGALTRDLAGKDIADLRSVGQQQQDQAQQGLDLAYTDFVNQRDYERNQLNYLNSIIRGMPITSNSETATYTHENPWSNIIGLGIGASGLINSFGGGNAGGTG